eukprot:CAMPEP_0170606126 /NCGR_PEP_ID=MMETSP0224-20130122/20340_1 /TAXON_ID=285029 /ORGANISM="Togula jolla, Strain CCCM 725" /LENGTH=116 /DNA_ID=CAMNT_0010931175 /DNA_START=1 /DNA_END=348 /DNA_ORIENTATION=+
MFSRFQHRVRILHNYPPALKEFSPTESWRNNSFEVIDLGSKELLFSKLDSSRSLVTGNDDFFENWMDKFAEKRGLGPLQPSSQVEAAVDSNEKAQTLAGRSSSDHQTIAPALLRFS